MAAGIEESITVDLDAELAACLFSPTICGSTTHPKAPRLAATCGFYRLAGSCQQVAASLLN